MPGVEHELIGYHERRRNVSTILFMAQQILDPDVDLAEFARATVQAMDSSPLPGGRYEVYGPKPGWVALLPIADEVLFDEHAPLAYLLRQHLAAAYALDVRERYPKADTRRRREPAREEA